MAYTVRRQLKPRLFPRMRLQGAPLAADTRPTREQLVTMLESARDGAIDAAIAAGIDDETINGLVQRSNALVEQIRQQSGPVSARLEREVAETVAVFQSLAATGRVPEGAMQKDEVPWLWIGAGVLGLGLLWWWANGRQQSAYDAAIDAAIEAGEIEDCGCGG